MTVRQSLKVKGLPAPSRSVSGRKLEMVRQNEIAEGISIHHIDDIQQPNSKRRRLNSPPDSKSRLSSNPPLTQLQPRNQPLPSNNKHVASIPVKAPSKNSVFQTEVSQKLEKRSLRSQDASSRPKSDLSNFFFDYEEFVFGPDKEPEFINAESTLYLVDKEPKLQALPIRKSSISLPIHGSSPAKSLSHKPDHLAVDTTKIVDVAPDNVFEKEDFSHIEAEAKELKYVALADSFYLREHKRSERKEKQLRNIERERAMHEKAELQRLLGELRGPDWMRTMGISGVTESQSKKFTPKRDYYIVQVRSLLKKFEWWRKGEQELKQQREAAAARAGAAEAVVEENSQQDAGDDDQTLEEKSEGGPSTVSTLAEAEASALQLQQEAQLASTQARNPHRPPKAPAEEPFRSFYKKLYLRDAAVGKHRRGRSATAFGHSIPELPEKWFSIPKSFVSEEIMTARARTKRRIKREDEECVAYVH